MLMICSIFSKAAVDKLMSQPVLLLKMDAYPTNFDKSFSKAIEDPTKS